MTIPIVSDGFWIATGINYDFNSVASVWHRIRDDMWEIVRAGARGERFEPASLTSDDVIRELEERGVKSVRG